ncbi:hypothetical protein OSTOST_22499 [Ostertagia ostertagi]
MEYDTATDGKQPISAAAAAAAAAVGADILSPSLATPDDSLRPFMEAVTLAAVLLLLILFCVIGNLFVIIAIACERDLRGRPQYYLIFSLAVADLIVSLYFDICRSIVAVCFADVAQIRCFIIIIRFLK